MQQALICYNLNCIYMYIWMASTQILYCAFYLRDQGLSIDEWYQLKFCSVRFQFIFETKVHTLCYTLTDLYDNF